MNCCKDYTRSHLLRASISEAGKGLPQIENGMPLPAGTGLSRRSFLSRSLGLAVSVYGASKLPFGALEEGIAKAQGSSSDTILVNIFFDGGVDSLSMLAPIHHNRYYQLRRNLALPQEPVPDPETKKVTPYTYLDEDPSLVFHPAAAGLAQLYKEGKVAVFPAIGYDDVNQSHFTSRHFWEVGELNTGADTGWLGKYLDIHGDNNNPLQGVTLSGSLSPTLATREKPVAAIDNVSQYSDIWSQGIWDGDWDHQIEERMFNTLKRFGNQDSLVPQVQKARQAAKQTAELRTELQSFKQFSSPVQYPEGNELGNRLKGLAEMIDRNMPIRVVSADAIGGYDTHDGQVAQFNGNVKKTIDAILAFQRDLERRNLDNRVLINLWSEFGRRPQENGSGTDHGAAGCAFLVGTRAKKGMVGEFPGLTTLDRDQNLRHTSDFRSLYASLLEDWLKVDATPIIPASGSMPRYALLD